MGLRQLSVRNILLLTIGALTLLITSLVVREVYVEWQRLAKIESLKEATLLADKLFEITEKLSVERDIAFSMLHARDRKIISTLRSRLEDSRREVDDPLQATFQTLKKYGSFPELAAQVRKSEEQFLTLRDLRRQIDRVAAQPMEKQKRILSERWFKESTALLLQTQDLWMEFTRHFTDVDPTVTLHMRFKYFLGIITEYTGRERSLIGRLIVEDADPTPQEVAQLLRWQGTVELGWSSCSALADQSRLSPAITPYLKDAESQYFTLYDMMRDIFYIPGAHHGTSYPIGVEQWFELTTEATDSLYVLKDAALKETRHYVETLETEAQRAIIVHSIILLFALALCFYSFWVITRRVIRPINDMVEALLNTAEGKPVSSVPPAHNQQDEIGKLAHVLHAFQQNMEDIKHTSAMLERYTSSLERSNKELDDFAYIASHDLKEPLRGIHNHARFLLEDNQDKLDADSVSRLGRLAYLSQRMERLVNDLLYFSRLGRQELAIGPADINMVIHDIESTLDVFLEEHHAQIVIPKSLPTITCDKTRITEVFRNLIVNAIKYNDTQKKMVEIGFLSTCASPNGILFRDVFYVKDNGRGIDAGFYEEIFRIFKRLQSNKELPEEGTGVGLTFVKKIIERHGGKIWLESEIGKGTTFYFILKEED